MVTPESTKRGIPSLDGLRALSIVFVIVAHLAFRQHVETGVTARLLNLGTLGVRIFFVISGFLITTLLVRELDGSGRIRLRRFYFRRVLRIFPAYYAYLATLAVLGTIGVVSTAGIRWLPALSYTSNLFPESWLAGHTWSLSVEEQFYICWPACLVLLGKRRALWAAVAVIALSPLMRLGAFVLTHVGAAADVPCFDAIAAGCVLALLWPTLRADARFQRLLASRWFMLVPLSTLGAYWAFTHQIRWLFVADIMVVQTFIAGGIALSIAWCILHPTGRIGRLLNGTWIRRIGVLSYSLYLWQQLFAWRGFPIPAWGVPIAALCAAGASYLLVERPGLALRESMEQRLQLFATPVPAQAIVAGGGEPA